MNFIDKAKSLVLDGEVQEASADVLADSMSALLGDPVSAGKVMKALVSSPFFIRDKLFWTKMETFLSGVYLSEEDCAKMRAKLMECGEKGDNPSRLVECIDRAETQQKIRYLINATRCLLSDFIDLPTYFRICHAITHTLEEDLQFLGEHLKDETNFSYSSYVQGLYTAGLMYQSVIDGNGNQKYSFTPIAELVDQYAISYDDIGRYPNPMVNMLSDKTPQISIPSNEWHEFTGNEVATDEEVVEMLDEIFK